MGEVAGFGDTSFVRTSASDVLGPKTDIKALDNMPEIPNVRLSTNLIPASIGGEKPKLTLT